MKLGKLLFGTLLLISSVSFSQEETEQEKECKRMRFLAGEELNIKNYAGATAYYIKGEKICGGYDKANYERLIASIRNTISGETDKVKKAAYIDTLIWAYDTQESKGFYSTANDLLRANYMVQATKPDRVRIDQFFSRGFADTTITPTETNVSFYYYNIYMMFTEAAEDKKESYKKRLITEYFNLSKRIDEAKMSVKTQENLTIYFNNVIKTCDDLLPELRNFMSSFPQETDKKKTTVNNFIGLLEKKDCTDSKEYEMLIDTLFKIDPTVDGAIAKARFLVSKKRYTEAISMYKQAKEMTSDAAKKEEIEYTIAEIQFSKLGSYNAAYSTAMGITGKYRSEALKLAAQCVAKTANNCGTSTFERKCNYLYAAELAQRAGDSGDAARYKASGPTADDWFTAGVSSLKLTCWGVTVSK